MLKNKRVVLVALAVVLLVLLFFIKTKSEWTNEEVASAGLVSGDEILGDVLSRDTDKDGILDWEEGLWGTDPTKKDTNDDGVSDKEEIGRMKAERAATSGEPASADSSGEASEENLTQTDKFARELFSTVAALSQSGEIDDNTVAQITDSLASQIQNPVQRKIFLMSDIKITQDNSQTAIEKYITEMNTLEPVKENATDILQESLTEDGDIDGTVLSKLNPIVEEISNFINGMGELEVPQKLASSHLELMNALERLKENLEDVQLIDTDAIVALGAMAQYENNDSAVEVATIKLNEVISNE